MKWDQICEHGSCTEEAKEWEKLAGEYRTLNTQIQKMIEEMELIEE